MNSKWLRSFGTVAQTGSVTAAAEKMFISPQALLQQINLLEREVDTELFIRSRAGMELTLAGREFLAGANTIMEIYDRTLTRCRLASQAENTIRIPMMSSIVLPQFMEEVCARFRRSGVSKFKTQFIHEDFGRWMEGLQNLKYDVIEHFAIDGLCPKDIYFEPLSHVKSWCVMADFHPLAKKTVLFPEDLDGARLLIPRVNGNLSAYLMINISSAGLHVNIDEIENDRYQVITGLNQGGIYLADENIAKVFIGYVGIPLDFDTHVVHGLACRKDMVEKYRPFFQVAKALADQEGSI